jgi:hypothetical protein
VACAARPGKSSKAFIRLFRLAAYTGVEYSFDEQEGRHGTTVRGDPGFVSYVEELAAAAPVAGEWAWAARRFADYVRPDSYLLRVDWEDDVIDCLSLYCRFPREPSDVEFDAAMERAKPLHWSGPSPRRVAEVLGQPGPRGVGLRVDRAGRHHVAVYYTVATVIERLPAAAIEQLIDVCGLPGALVETVHSDVASLYPPPGPVGVIGIDAGPTAIKLNPANVPFERAFAFMTARGAAATRIRGLREIANALRARWLTYLGVRYAARGFSGWKAYFSTVPLRLASATAPVVLGRSAIPTLRLPHY